MADMTMEEALDMNIGDTESESEDEEEEKVGGSSTSPATPAILSSGTLETSVVVPEDSAMDLDGQDHFSIQTASDPRRRPPFDVGYNPWVEQTKQMDVLSATNQRL